MVDIIKKYRKNKILSNINIVLVSLTLALGINFILIDGTHLGKSLKTSVLNTKIETNKSDISIEKFDTNIFIIANKNISDLQTLSFSLTYNSENLDINNITSKFGEILNISNTPGINSVILTCTNSINIKRGDKLASIKLKKKKNKSENINILNANFKDMNSEHYTLSTSGIIF